MIRSRSFGSSEGFARTSSGASHCAPGPCSRSIGSRSPPDPLPQSFGVRLKAQTPRRIGKHRTQVWLGEALPPQQLEKFFGMSPSHLCIVIAFNRTVAKIAPTIDDLLGRTAADTQLQASTSDQIRSLGLCMWARRGKPRPSERNQSHTLRAGPSSVNFANTVRMAPT